MLNSPSTHDPISIDGRFFAVNPGDGRPMEPEFLVASFDEVDAAATAAADCSGAYLALDADRRADFLDAIARGIENLGEALISRASSESGLPPARLTGERTRTCNQLRMFASLIREGSWVDARIDTGDAARASGPKPDLRRMLIPLGPVAVFGASNFPLAFSVAGGDTASALAAGCPVVVKAHPSHPGTSEMVATAVRAAIQETGMPIGVFGMVHGGKEVGERLVIHSGIEAVGFTGSLGGGRALFDLAASRPRPIPVFAEMGSVNPVFILPAALEERFDAIVKGYMESLTAGVGQFCTNPGIVVGVEGALFSRFLAEVATRVADVAPGVMLSPDILSRYRSGLQKWSSDARLEELGASAESENRAHAAFFSTTGRQVVEAPELLDEVFGPAAISVTCESSDDLVAVASNCGGQLTATIHFADRDLRLAQRLVPILTRHAGRVLANGYPTGVEVGSAMQHGGPYPATTDSRTTSVGTAAILRFARPVAYQNFPVEILPPELRDENPRKLLRLLNGVPSRDPIEKGLDNL